jgi:tetratricopeptide (TPR) repeat protein
VPLQPLTLKGKSQPVAAWRLVSLSGGTQRTDSSVHLPFVGRDRELAAVRGAWDASRRDRCWRHVDLVGVAGVGKSRLLHEVLELDAGEALVARGSCPSYGEGISFLPVIELVRDAVGITQDDDADVSLAALRRAAPDDDVAGLLADLVGLTDGDPPLAELFWAVRSFFAHLGTTRPLILVLDGLQSVQPTLVDLLDEMLELGGDQPVLVVTMSRDEPDGADHPRRDRVDVEPLGEQSMNDLLSFTLGYGVLDTGVRDRLTLASEGLPLFIEQLLRSLVDQGVLRRSDAGWVATKDLGDIEVPPSVEAMLAARIDALPAPERSVVDTASVIGREFGARAVSVLLGPADVAPELRELERRQLVARSPSPDRLGDHRFRSPMTRDVAYGSLLKRERARLHRAYGDWVLDAATSDTRRELEEVVGYHLERSFHLTQEVATVDDELAAVGRRAAGHLGDSGQRAFVRGDMPAAANLLGRAAGTLPRDPADAAELLVLAGEASFEQGEFDEALRRYDRAEALAEDAGAVGLVTLARIARTTQRYLTGDGVEGAEAMSEAMAAQQVLAPLGDHVGLARASRLRAYVDMTMCRWGAAEQAARETLEQARAGGDAALERRVLPALSSFALYGPTPVPQARARCEELLSVVGGDRRARCLIERSLAHLMAMEGQTAEAAELCSSTRDRLKELGWNFDAALVSLDLGPIHLLAGDARSAERELRVDHDTLSAMGEQNYLATISYLLADAVRRLGREDEALELVAEAESLAAEDDISASAGWRLVRARVLVDRGDVAAALPWALAAQELLATTDELTSQAECLLDLAQIRSASGEEELALAHIDDAAERYRAKGHRVGVERCAELRVRAG